MMHCGKQCAYYVSVARHATHARVAYAFSEKNGHRVQFERLSLGPAILCGDFLWFHIKPRSSVESTCQKELVLEVFFSMRFPPSQIPLDTVSATGWKTDAGKEKHRYWSKMHPTEGLGDCNDSFRRGLHILHLAIQLRRASFWRMGAIAQVQGQCHHVPHCAT